jgi:hypothetical protein
MKYTISYNAYCIIVYNYHINTSTCWLRFVAIVGVTHSTYLCGGIQRLTGRGLGGGGSGSGSGTGVLGFLPF